MAIISSDIIFETSKYLSNLYEQGHYTRIYKIKYTNQMARIFLHGHIAKYLTPKKDYVTHVK